MSGGGNRKKNTRSQGWEEAGAEFYQESYPVDSEIEFWQKDPKRLATLLPSKQTRAAAATIRIKTNDYKTNNRTVRRHTSTIPGRESSVRRRTSTVGGDVQVSMLPDLSEMRTNEETAWEEVMQIKTLPVPMSQKKEIKAKIMNEPNLRLQGYEQFNWKRRKMWNHFESSLKETLQKLELWRGSLKHIEGSLGTGVVAYFLFLKWLLLLNLIICIVICLFLTLPTVLLRHRQNVQYNETDCGDCCATQYFNESLGNNNLFLDLVQGTGILERTIMFYGFYSNNSLGYSVGDVAVYYNIPLVYMFLTLFYFLFSLIVILRTAAKGFKERLVEGEGQFYQYCNLVFGGWDFCVNNEKSARMKHKAIYNEIKATLETEKLEEERQGRTRQEKYKILINRILINVIVVTILFGCACGIYLIFDFSTKRLQKQQTNSTSGQNFEQLSYEFLPSITIVGLNLVVPTIFNFLIAFEKYSPIVQIRLSLIRNVFLRLASLIVYYASFKNKVSCDNIDDDSQKCVPCSKVPLCWETFVGQQIYKLLLTDFATHVILTFTVNFFRSLLARHVNNRFVKLLGEQTFDLPRHALDVVYTQTLCWFGIFYAPLISLMATVIFFFMFYIKKFACLVNCKPSPIIYRASRSNSMFMVVLLVSYLFAVLPIAYSISELLPSKSCGPFSDKQTVWTLVVDLFLQWPDWLQWFVFFLNTAGFAIPLFILLLLFLYYYSAVNSANRHMVLVLKNQLILEGHDKQFLLDRLSLFIKQENQKRVRAERNMRDGDKST